MKYRFILCIICSFILCGCSSMEMSGMTENIANSVVNAGVVTEQTEQTEFDGDHAKMDSTADNVTGIAVDYAEVKKAYALITGNVALIGLDLKEELDDTDLINLKSKIKKDVKEKIRGIDHVTVTASPELVDKILNSSKSKDKPNNIDRENDAIIRISPTI